MTKKPSPQIIYNEKITYSQRLVIACRWVDGLIYVRKQLDTSNAVLDNAVQYVNTHVGFGVPIANIEGRWGLRRKAHENYTCFLVPIVQSDAALHAYFKKQVGVLSYNEGSRSIFLPADRMSALWRGLVLYHELLHAMYHQQQRHRRRKNGHWVEEYEIYKEEIKIVQSLYGESFSEAVCHLSEGFEQELNNHNLFIRDKKLVSRPLLRRVFGRSNSELERGVQRGVILLAALYLALDRIHKDGSKEEYYAVTRWFYGGAAKKTPNIKHK